MIAYFLDLLFGDSYGLMALLAFLVICETVFSLIID